MEASFPKVFSFGSIKTRIYNKSIFVSILGNGWRLNSVKRLLKLLSKQTLAMLSSEQTMIESLCPSLTIELVFDTYDLQAGIFPHEFDRKSDLWLFSKDFLDSPRIISQVTLSTIEELQYFATVVQMADIKVGTINLQKVLLTSTESEPLL
jgi:hypothetical protein